MIKRSIDCLCERIKTIEGHSDDLGTTANASMFATKLESLDSEFREVHYQIISFYYDDHDLEEQQSVLNNHDEKVSSLIL